MNRPQDRALSSLPWIGVARSRVIAGHILFGATYPHAKIFQVYVGSEHRKHGIGRLLVQTLLQLLEEKQYLSVTARVASELPADAFWHSLKFEIVATKTGGMTRGRTINVRAKQFNTPALFGYRRPVSGIPLTDPLPNFTTILALDLNVFFDVAKRQSTFRVWRGRHERSLQQHRPADGHPGVCQRAEALSRPRTKTRSWSSRYNCPRFPLPQTA